MDLSEIQNPNIKTFLSERYALENKIYHRIIRDYPLYIMQAENKLKEIYDNDLEIYDSLQDNRVVINDGQLYIFKTLDKNVKFNKTAFNIIKPFVKTEESVIMIDKLDIKTINPSEASILKSNGLINDADLRNIEVCSYTLDYKEDIVNSLNLRNDEDVSRIYNNEKLLFLYGKTNDKIFKVDLKNIKYLNLNGSSNLEDFKIISGEDSLETISLFDTSVDLAKLLIFKNLKNITSYTFPKEFTKIPHLETLEVNSELDSDFVTSDISDILRELSAITGHKIIDDRGYLTKLKVSNPKDHKDCPIIECPNLVEVNLSCQFPKLKNLMSCNDSLEKLVLDCDYLDTEEEIELFRSKLDIGLLAQYINLKHLELNNINLNPAFNRSKVFDSLVNLETLGIETSEPFIYCFGLFQGLKSLTSISLDNGYIDSEKVWIIKKDLNEFADPNKVWTIKNLNGYYRTILDGLDKLKIVKLRRIHAIPNNLFHKTPAVEHVEIKRSSVYKIYDDLFLGLKLKYLKLSELSKIKSLSSKLLENQFYLTNLDIAFNKFESLDFNLLKDLYSLTDLKYDWSSHISFSENTMLRNMYVNVPSNFPKDFIFTDLPNLSNIILNTGKSSINIVTLNNNIFSKLPNLTNVSLLENFMVTEKLLASICNVSYLTLENVKFENTNVFKHFKNLERLDVKGPISDRYNNDKDDLVIIEDDFDKSDEIDGFECYELKDKCSLSFDMINSILSNNKDLVYFRYNHYDMLK